jgi:DNA polymerase I
MTTTPTISDYKEIWAIDFEFYPGPGLANGGREGDLPTPLCLVAIEIRTGRVIHQWCDEFGSLPPYRIDNGALIVSYMSTAEFSCHLALGWPQPACTFDAYVEFRHLTNDGSAKGREKGFYSLPGALQYFGENGIDTAHKTDMRGRIVQGPPFSADEREAIQKYCEDDVRALVRVFKYIAPTVRSWPHALFQCQVTWAVAREEQRGIPLDRVMLPRLRANWNAIQHELVIRKDPPFGIYEIVDGKPHWRDQRFADYLHRNNMAWPERGDGSPDLRDVTFRDMIGRYPHIQPLRELRASLSDMRLNSLAVGNDGRNRTMLGPYGSKTGRNQPSNSKFIFGPAKWTRFLITPHSPDRVLIHRDYAQQEPQIAAVVSGDEELLAICLSGDVYLGIASALGFVSEGATVEELATTRTLFKTVVLGILYGLGVNSLAMRAGISRSEAGEILARLRARFRAFEYFAASVGDHSGLDLEICTPFRWYMRCPPHINPRTVRNFPVQSTGAEVLHVAIVLAERRGLEVVAPIHDALVIEADTRDAEDANRELDRVMGDAGSVVLRGYRLRTDAQPIIRYGGRFYDKAGVEMWNTVSQLLVEIERNAA